MHFGFESALFKKHRHSDKQKKVSLRIMLMLTVIGLLAVLTRTIGMVFGLLNSGYAIAVPAALTTLFFIGLYILGCYNPSIVGLSIQTIKKVENKKIDTDQLDFFQNTIQQKQLYLNPDLTLPLLAGQLKISHHELSQIINTTAQANFTQFINYFRIKHAQKLLLDQPHMPVVEIAYASGFNSKSVFYSHFNKQTGMTPSEFKEAS